ncbi:MAG: RecQ family ATP-dependent DNA helicase, partial [Saprospiraceae bacterium]|nr:RecQ family ATP-dependent DNA helicase [Saprospiraceae bacterium]
MPTGGGKSLCFQIPGLCLGATTVVVSPLLSLMQDQVAHLVAKKVAACTINSSLKPDERLQRLTDFSQGKYTFVYISPETLLSQKFVAAAQTARVKLLIVDESHCIAEWGHDFRPEYLQIAKFLTQLPQRPTVAAFTATATPVTQTLICTSLRLRQPQIFKQSFKRINLKLAIKICPDRFTQELLLGRILDHHRGQMGIIYSATRASAEYLAEYFGQYYPGIAAYHGGMPADHRAQIQALFQAGKYKIIVATNAFGMGVDQSNIRFVVHYHVPSSLEAYYQEIGRGGRDGADAQTYGLFFPRDLSITAGFLPDPDSPLYVPKAAKLQTMLKFIASHTCRNQILLEYFGEAAPAACQSCDNCQPISWDQSLLEDQRYKTFLQIRDRVAHQYRIPSRQLMTNQVVRLLAL